MNLIDNWRESYKFLSQQAAVANMAVIGTWVSLPSEFKQAIPVDYVLYLALSVLILGFIGRLVKQNNVKEAV